MARDDVETMRKIFNGEDKTWLEPDDLVLRSMAGLELAELLQKKGRLTEAKSVMQNWISPVRALGKCKLELSSFSEFMDIDSPAKGRAGMQKTRIAIGLNDTRWITNMAFDEYQCISNGQARRAGMQYLRQHSPEEFERADGYFRKIHKVLSFNILDYN